MSFRTIGELLRRPLQEFMRSPEKRRYVLAKSYYGMGGDLCVMLSAQMLALNTGRTLIVDWSGGRYGDAIDRDVFGHFFSSPVLEHKSELAKCGVLSVFPPVWQGRELLPPLTQIPGQNLTQSSPSDVPADCLSDLIVITRDARDLMQKFDAYSHLAQSLHPHQRILERVTGIFERMKDVRVSIGVHFRHGNGERAVIPPNPKWFRNRVNAILQASNCAPHELGLYVATDSPAVVEYFKRYYPRVIHTDTRFRPNGSGALHVSRNDLDSPTKVELGDDALTDIYALSRCNHFIGSRGYFSLFVRMLRSDKNLCLAPGGRLYDDYNFSDKYYPVSEDAVVAADFSVRNVPTDGVFVRIEQSTRSVYYYNNRILELPLTQSKISSKDSLKMRQALYDLRTY